MDLCQWPRLCYCWSWWSQDSNADVLFQNPALPSRPVPEGVWNCLGMQRMEGQGAEGRQVLRRMGSHEEGGEAGEAVGPSVARTGSADWRQPVSWMLGGRLGAGQSTGPLCWTPCPGRPGPENGPSWSLMSCFGRTLGVRWGMTEFGADISCNLDTLTCAHTHTRGLQAV